MSTIAPTFASRDIVGDRRADLSSRRRRRSWPPGNRSFALAAVVTLLAGVVPAVIWPGEISWMCDEPVLLSQAHYYNVAHVLAPRGLGGTLNVAYGPLPTQLYQLLLLTGADLRAIVAMHALLLSATLALSLLWLARTLKLTPWFATAVVLAPYLWWGQRVLWDASLVLPLGMFGVAAYASHLRSVRAWKLGAAAGALFALPLIHPQCLPLLLAVGLHALASFRLRLWRQWTLVLPAIALVLLPNASYLHYVRDELTPRAGHLLSEGYHGKAVPLGRSLTGPLLSGRLFDADVFCSESCQLRAPLSESAVVVSRLIIPLIWLGMLAASAVVLRKLFFPTTDRKTKASDHARNALAAIAIIALGLQMALAAQLHVPPLPQYCFGTFPMHVLFGWLGVETLRRIWLGHAVTAIWGVALAYVTLGSAWQVHTQGWDRWRKSPSLSNQIEIAQKLDGYSDTTVLTNVINYQQYPAALRALRNIVPTSAGAPRRLSPHGLLIRYIADPNPDSTRIELVELTADAGIPAGASAMDVTALPKLY